GDADEAPGRHRLTRPPGGGHGSRVVHHEKGNSMTTASSPAGFGRITPSEHLDLRPSARAEELRAELIDFMRTEVFPAEAVYEEQLIPGGGTQTPVPPVVGDLKASARRRGLWNLF